MANSTFISTHNGVDIAPHESIMNSAQSKPKAGSHPEFMDAEMRYYYEKNSKGTANDLFNTLDNPTATPPILEDVNLNPSETTNDALLAAPEQADAMEEVAAAYQSAITAGATHTEAVRAARIVATENERQRRKSSEVRSFSDIFQEEMAELAAIQAEREALNAGESVSIHPVQNPVSFLAGKSMNRWLMESAAMPNPRMLFSEFWFEGELCILFADANVGKSILAIQIGDSISRGYPIPGFQLSASPQPVLYFDFELSAKQIEARYSNDYQSHYRFSDHLMRYEINPEAMFNEQLSHETLISRAIEEAILHTDARVLIIDNITYLRSETERAKDALPLMKELKRLKMAYNLSILALAHTPKRDAHSVITQNDLQGSKMLMNFCDSSFAIGASQMAPQLRYIKQIKQRNTQLVYGTSNVIVCNISKPTNFLQFEFMEYANEIEHLRQDNASHQPKEELIQQVLQLKNRQMSCRQIAKQLGISASYVSKLLCQQEVVRTQEASQ
jgi:hypothetical protein